MTEAVRNTNKQQINYFFVTYGDKNYSIQRKRIKFQAKKFKLFKNIFVYKKSSLDKSFKNRFSALLEDPKGGGFWIWKSQIILQSLEKMNENDILIYVDSGSTMNLKGKKRLVEYFEMLNNSTESIFLFRLPGIFEKNWTTKEVFNYFGVSGNNSITDSLQFMGGVLLVKNNKASKKFFKDFQKVVENDNNLITNYYQKYQEEYFNTCRHDQSILSVMGKIYGCLALDDESFYFNNPEEQYSWPILTVRDNVYNKWQKLKFYGLYPLNIRKIIFFKAKPFYFKNKATVYSKVYNKYLVKMRFKN